MTPNPTINIDFFKTPNFLDPRISFSRALNATYAGKNEGEDGIDWEQFYGAVRTSYNTAGGVYYDPQIGQPAEDQTKAFRKNYAGPGYTYDPIRDAFIPPKPHSSWILNESTCCWDPPVSYLNDGK